MSEYRKTLTADERDQAGGPAKRRINVTESRDLKAFAIEFGCTRDELTAAIGQVGNIVSDVAGFLKGKKLQPATADKVQATAALRSLFER